MADDDTAVAVESVWVGKLRARGLPRSEADRIRDRRRLEASSPVARCVECGLRAPIARYSRGIHEDSTEVVSRPECYRCFDADLARLGRAIRVRREVLERLGREKADRAFLLVGRSEADLARFESKLGIGEGN